MKDPYTDMFVEFMGYSVFLVIVMTILAGVSGCTTQIAPNLKIPEAKACPTLAMPPIAGICTLYIRGDKIVADDCGDTLLRGYVRARSLLKPAAVVTSNPQ